MEYWVWLDCERHHQLRDLVGSAPGFGASEEQIKCGCRYKAEDFDLELSRLRMYEGRRDSERMAKYAAILAYRPSKRVEIPWLLLALMASILCGLMWLLL